jgi:hypothetical protein
MRGDALGRTTRREHTPELAEIVKEMLGVAAFWHVVAKELVISGNNPDLKRGDLGTDL